MVDGALGEHGVVLELGLAEGRGVAGDEDQLGLAHAELLERGLVSKDDCARVSFDAGGIYPRGNWETYPCRTSSQARGAS